MPRHGGSCLTAAGSERSRRRSGTSCGGGYLKHLPFDLLKIDGEFGRHLGESVKDQLVVQSLARIATELGKQTVAESVEDEETLELVRSYGVDFAQGFGIGLPEPVSEWRSLELAGGKAAVSAS